MLAAKEDAVEVGAVHGMPIFERGMFRIMNETAVLKSRNAGVVDQNIQASAFVENLCHDGLPLTLIAHVKMDIARLTAQADG